MAAVGDYYERILCEVLKMIILAVSLFGDVTQHNHSPPTIEDCHAFAGMTIFNFPLIIIR